MADFEIVTSDVVDLQAELIDFERRYGVASSPCLEDAFEDGEDETRISAAGRRCMPSSPASGKSPVQRGSAVVGLEWITGFLILKPLPAG